MSETTKTFERLTPQNAVFLPIDYMSGLMNACRTMDYALLKNNAIALAKVARVFNLPTICAGERTGSSALGTDMPEMAQILPDMQYVPRTSVGAWDMPEYREAVRRTGRKKLIMAGITLEQCVTFTAEPAIADGYEVYIVLDASASLDDISERGAISRLGQKGAILSTWSPIAAEIMHDYSTPEGGEVIKIYSEHQGQLSALQESFKTTLKFAAESAEQTKKDAEAKA